MGLGTWWASIWDKTAPLRTKLRQFLEELFSGFARHRQAGSRTGGKRPYTTNQRRDTKILNFLENNLLTNKTLFCILIMNTGETKKKSLKIGSVKGVAPAMSFFISSITPVVESGRAKKLGR